MEFTTLTALLESARRDLTRLTPAALAGYLDEGDAVVLDTRTPTDRATYGCIPGSFHTPRTVLEWRVALDAPLRISQVTNHDQLLVVVCNEGFSSSLAARSLQTLGFWRATDLIGGVLGWSAAGLPVVAPKATSAAFSTNRADKPSARSANMIVPPTTQHPQAHPGDREDPNMVTVIAHRAVDHDPLPGR